MSAIEFERMRRIMNCKNGFALVSVLLLCMILMIFITTLFFKTGSQKGTHGILLEQTKALHLARGVMQLALYKFKVLPTEFYRLENVKKSGSDTVFLNSWMADFDPAVATSPIRRILTQVPDINLLNYTSGVNDFSIQAQEDLGYKKDFLRIRAFGKCNQQQKQIEELVEVIREQ
ncbi:hypothetical protein HYY75_06065 [bacterium]|nr:hypothetical protein [bacterium]